MHIKTRNVNTAFHTLVDLFYSMKNATGRYRPNSREWERLELPRYRETTSRNGPVALIDEPLTITYTSPTERVLFNPVRDANPFFHVYEALWMLAGRDDVGSVSYYARQMREYSDDGSRLNGAYGRRWRATQGVPQLTRNGYMRPGIDQLLILAAHLKKYPDSRRAVLRMWNVEEDLLKIGGGCTCGADRTGPSAEAHAEHCPAKYNPSKDVCCNLEVMFSIRHDEVQHTSDFKGYGLPGTPTVGKITIGSSVPFLDMTVTNRSNDMLWGMLGANYVHFSFLLEYMAARTGTVPGFYHHFSNNCHVYTARPDWKPEDLLDFNSSPLSYDDHKRVPLVKDPATFDDEVQHLVEQYSGVEPMANPLRPYTEPFLNTVAQPLFDAWLARKKGTGTVHGHLARIADDSWRTAAEEWVRRREKK